MDIFNYIIANSDLHDDNYGLLYDSEKFEFKSVSPCYDHNVAFQEGFLGLSRISPCCSSIILRASSGYTIPHILLKVFILNGRL